MLYAILKKMSNSELEHIRKPQYKINPLIINRWSPRSMTGEELRDEDLMSLFEAARWAPSCANAQPWRFIYATRNAEEWNTLFNLLEDFNKIWAKKCRRIDCCSLKKRNLNIMEGSLHL
jgi:hypothetical protein